MNRTMLFSAAAFGAALIATPTLAQTSGGTINEMRREQANPATPYVPQQNRVAAEADAMGRQEVGRWLDQADQALRRGRMGEASELLERAETRLLTRSTLATAADRPFQGPVVERISEARRALMQRNRDGAMQSIAAARSALPSLGNDLATGAGASTMPAQGGGSAVIQDRGMGSSTMSRVDAVGLLQRPRSDVVRVQGSGGGSGGLSGSSPGSPGAGMQGSTPSVLPETPQQPGQTSALPGANVRGGAGASSAPAAGPVGAPPPGSGGIGVGTDQRGRTVTPTTPGGSTSR